MCNNHALFQISNNLDDHEKDQGNNKTGVQQVMDSQFHLDHKKHKG